MGPTGIAAARRLWSSDRVLLGRGFIGSLAVARALPVEASAAPGYKLPERLIKRNFAAGAGQKTAAFPV
jgi:hypothetical protein